MNLPSWFIILRNRWHVGRLLWTEASVSGSGCIPLEDSLWPRNFSSALPNLCLFLFKMIPVCAASCWIDTKIVISIATLGTSVSIWIIVKYKVASQSIQKPFLHTILCCIFKLKWIKYTFMPINQHLLSHNVKWKHVFRNVCKCINVFVQIKNWKLSFI